MPGFYRAPQRVIVAALLLLVLPACQASASSSNPTEIPSVSYFPSATPQLRLEQNGRQVMVTLLRNDLVHVAYHDKLEAGTPYFSPMLAQTQFSGPTAYQYDEKTKRLSSSDLAIELEGNCWRISDISGATAQVLTRLCVNNWAPKSLQLGLSAEDYSSIFGLGQKLSTSRTTPSWLGEQRHTGNDYGNAMTYSDIAASGNTQIPVAYVLGSGLKNYGLFFDSPYALQFDFSGANWKVDSPRESIGVFVFSGPDLADLRRDYLQLTGKPPVPPLKAFGLWLSEFGFDNWAELDSKLTTLRTNDFPIDGAVLDLQWFGGITSGSGDTSMGKVAWDTRNFPNPAAKVAQYGADGLGLVLIEESYIGSELPEHKLLADQGFLPIECLPKCQDPVFLETNPWWGVGSMMDWSNPQAGAYWQNSKRSALINDGILGHWTDLGEPEIYSYSAKYHGFDWYGHAATDHKDIHNLYNFFWNESISKETARTHPDRRPWILSRSGTAGSQRFGVAMWSGDVGSYFETLGAQMTAQTNMSLSGFDYYGSDVGGFHRNGISGRSFNQLYTRWLVSSSLLDIPVRPHVMNLCNCNETAPDRVGDKASNLAALNLRYQLAPYLYSLAHHAHQNGDAVFPPLMLYYQDDLAARAVDKTKMIGPWLLFTALTDDAVNVSSYLPRGVWVDFLDPNRVVSSKGELVSQPVINNGLVRAPLFLREGAIVPMLQTAPKHLATNVKKIQWFSDLLIRTYPVAKESRFVLVEDDGISRAYEKGQVARTTLTAQQTSTDHIRVAVNPDNQTGATAKRQLNLEVMTNSTTIKTVSLNGQALTPVAANGTAPGWYQAAGFIGVRLGEVDVNSPLELTLAP